MTEKPNNNGTKTYKWAIGILVGVIISIISFTVGGQILTPIVRETVSRVDILDVRVEQTGKDIAEIKIIIKEQNEKLDKIYQEM